MMQPERPESVRIEFRMADHTRVIELLPGDDGLPPLKANFDWNREAIEVPNPDGLPWRHFEPSPEAQVTLKATCGKTIYNRIERTTGETPEVGNMTGMDELIAWLRQQLDEDERVAREAAYWGDLPLGHLAGDVESHLIRWDPARVLAEVEAKRRVLDEHELWAGGLKAEDYEEAQTAHEKAESLGQVIKLLAQPYAGRPGWREEWRVA